MRSVAPLAALIVLTALLASPAAAAMVESSQAASPQGGLAQTTAGNVSALAGGDLSEPSTTMDVFLQPDRSADWEVTVEYDLTTASQRAAFDAFADEFESGSAAVGPSVDLYRNIATRVSEQTGREMTVTDAAYSATRQGETGRLTLSFTWSGFLQSVTEDDTQQLVFNDVLRTADDETWLRSLRENQRLRIHTPSGYAITTANVGFSSNTVEVTGPRTFEADDHISIVYEESVFGAGTVWFLGVAVIVASLIVGGAILLRRTDRVNVRETVLPGEQNGSPTADGVDTSDAGDGPDPGADSPAPADQSNDVGSQGDPAGEPQEDLTLLADDERVERLLERNGGRMRQADIVDETGWSDAKVSQLLSSMADDGQVSKLRIGRENLITLPDVDAVGDDATDESDGGGDDRDTSDADDSGADESTDT